MADGSSGLQVIDITDPTNPTLVGTYDTPGTAYGVTVSGDRAFVADCRFRAPGDRYQQIPRIPRSWEPATRRAVPGASPSRATTLLWRITASGLQVIQVFQSEVDPGKNMGRSLAVDASNDAILRARVMTTQTNTVTWELSADGGVTWQGTASNGSWDQLTVPGSDLVWRSTHTWAAPGVNPGVTHLEIDWLYAFGVVDAIEDIPNDQGRQVRITWTRSGNDFVGASPQITEYAVYRKIDANLPLSMVSKGGVVPEDPALVYPPGQWDFVMTVPADAEDEYSAVVPTLADSTIAGGMYRTTFFVRARTATPGVYFNSYPDSGYSVDNLSPSVPAGFAVAYHTGSGNHLTWDPSPDQDFRYFKIYRGTTPDFVPGPGNEAQATAGTEWTDPSPVGWTVYYKITALDYAGNESDPASPESTTGIGDVVIPKVYALYQNVPNPFNPETVIRYDVPAGGGNVTLRVFDVSGKLVRTLVYGVEPAGERTVQWNGRNEKGEQVSTGVYFYRLEAGSFTERKKMVLLK